MESLTWVVVPIWLGLIQILTVSVQKDKWVSVSLKHFISGLLTGHARSCPDASTNALNESGCVYSLNSCQLILMKVLLSMRST